MNNTLYCLFVLALLLQACGRGDEDVDFPLIGKVKPRPASEIESSNWIIGCETLDRDYADYDQYKEYLVPLGIKRLRIQSGWAKCEREKGVYDWSWLDHIVDDACGRGLEPWLQLSYGNPVYEGGGGINLAAGVPTSETALVGWDMWVAAMVSRYQDRVKEWEVWNEPNFGDNLYNTPEKAAALNIRTARIIMSIQPDARIAGLSMGHIDLEYADTFFSILSREGCLDLFDNMTYHDYVYNPDSHYPKVMKLKAILEKYDRDMPLRQGENGAPSRAYMGGALGDNDWSERSQAKWNTRRMLGDLGHDLESSVFTIIDIAYTAGPITKLNVKGLIRSDSTKRALGTKLAYSAIQHITSVFDNSLERLSCPGKEEQVNGEPGGLVVSTSCEKSLAIYAYRKRDTGRNLFTIWLNGEIPLNTDQKEPVSFTVHNAKIEQAVYVDIISGDVYEIPEKNINRRGHSIEFRNIPIYDGPVLIADSDLIRYVSQK